MFAIELAQRTACTASLPVLSGFGLFADICYNSARIACTTPWWQKPNCVHVLLHMMSIACAADALAATFVWVLPQHCRHDPVMLLYLDLVFRLQVSACAWGRPPNGHRIQTSNVKDQMSRFAAWGSEIGDRESVVPGQKSKARAYHRIHKSDVSGQ